MIKNTIIKFLKSAITTLLIIVANCLLLIGMPTICSDFHLGPYYNSIFIIVGVSVANIILWPIFRKIFIKLILFTLGISALFVNSLIYFLVILIIPDASIGIWGLLEIPLLSSIVTTSMFSLTNTDYFENYEKTLRNKYKENRSYKRYPGIIMLEIDGLSKNILQKALDKGVMPTLKNWLENTHTLKGWETDLSSQTGASQAGILHGNNENIVAYRWVEKENDNRIIVSGKLSHAPLIEKRISDGNGLLKDGISITNMFSGDSKTAPLTSSKIQNVLRLYNTSLNTIFEDAYNFPRIIVLFLWDILVELKSQILHVLKNIQPRIRRTIIYAAIRAGANVILRETTTEILAATIIHGNEDTAYATYMGYDEVAHHSGVMDPDVWGVLKQIDKQFYRLQKTIEDNERKYEIVVLSDHGQVNGATFKQRYGLSLGNYVRKLLPDDLTMFKSEYNIDHFRDVFIPESKNLKNIKEKVEDLKNIDIFEEIEIIQNLKEKGIKLISENEQLEKLAGRYGSNLDYIKKHSPTNQSTKKAKDSELIVLGSGNLALIYLTQWMERLNYEEIILLFPDLIPGLVNHPGIGFILVESITNGPMVIGSQGIYYLNTDKIIGQNPLANFGKNAPMHLKRHNSFNNMPDILVNSFYDPECDEVCAFEELIGSHGGMGGDQCKPFILYPSYWKDPGELIGAASVYNFLKREIDDLNP